MEKFIVKVRPIIVNGVALAENAALETCAEFSSPVSAEMFLDDYDSNWKENSIGTGMPICGLRDGCLISAILKRGTTVYSASVTKVEK
jgi:hypothetical protein